MCGDIVFMESEYELLTTSLCNCAIYSISKFNSPNDSRFTT